MLQALADIPVMGILLAGLPATVAFLLAVLNLWRAVVNKKKENIELKIKTLELKKQIAYNTPCESIEQEHHEDAHAVGAFIRVGRADEIGTKLRLILWSGVASLGETRLHKRGRKAIKRLNSLPYRPIAPNHEIRVISDTEVESSVIHGTEEEIYGNGKFHAYTSTALKLLPIIIGLTVLIALILILPGILLPDIGPSIPQFLVGVIVLLLWIALIDSHRRNERRIPVPLIAS